MTEHPTTPERQVREVTADYEQRVSVRPRRGQSADSLNGDVERSLRFGQRIRARGATEWTSHYRWWGPIKVMVAKEVGPPPWRFPRVRVNVKWPFLSLVVGWRSTAFHGHVMWTGLR